MADQEVDERFELYTTDGTGPPVKLSGTLVVGGDVQSDLLFSPDGARVFFRADGELDERFELYMAPSDGSAPAVVLSGIPVANGDVRPGFRVTPDGTKVLYSSDPYVSFEYRLFRTNSNGFGDPVLLSTIHHEKDVNGILIDPTGTWAVYHASNFSLGHALYSVRIQGGTPPVQLSDEPAGGGYIGDLDYIGETPGFQITPDGTKVLYLASPFDGLDQGRFFVVPIDRSSPPPRLNGPLATSEAVWAFLLDPSGSAAAYMFGQVSHRQMALVSLNASPSVLLNRTPTAGGVQFDFRFSPDGKKFLHRLDLEQVGAFELFASYLYGRPFSARAPVPSSSVSTSR